MCEAATGHIYRLPGENQFDLDQYRAYTDQLHQLGKVKQDCSLNLLLYTGRFLVPGFKPELLQPQLWVVTGFLV